MHACLLQLVMAGLRAVDASGQTVCCRLHAVFKLFVHLKCSDLLAKKKALTAADIALDLLPGLSLHMQLPAPEQRRLSFLVSQYLSSRHLFYRAAALDAKLPMLPLMLSMSGCHISMSQPTNAIYNSIHTQYACLSYQINAMHQRH